MNRKGAPVPSAGTTGQAKGAKGFLKDIFLMGEKEKPAKMKSIIPIMLFISIWDLDKKADEYVNCAHKAHKEDHMNITLSADKEIIERSRKYAKKHNTSLNNLVRDFLEKVSGRHDVEANADEFAHLAKSFPGESKSGFRFDRDTLYDRTI